MDELYRKICNTIVEDGNCHCVTCGGLRGGYVNAGSPCLFLGCDCDEREIVKQAKKWLSEHPAGCEFCRDQE